MIMSCSMSMNNNVFNRAKVEAKSKAESSIPGRNKRRIEKGSCGRNNRPFMGLTGKDQGTKADPLVDGLT